MFLGFDSLIAATVLFVASHFLLSGDPVRAALVEHLGGRLFRGLYAAVAVAAIAWMIVAYADAPIVPLWPRAPALDWVPVLVMPVALTLVVAGATTPSPTTPVPLRADGQAPTDPVPIGGILTVTRHPVLWAIALWAASHLMATGDMASLIMIGGLLVLALGGMRHIDRRRETELGSAWGPVLLTTSAVPFAAALAGRTQLDWSGIGWWRPALGLALYAALLAAHEWALGVSALPG